MGCDFIGLGASPTEDRTAVAGIPVTSVPRTLLDCAAAIPPRRLLYALERAERLGVFDLGALERLLARSRRRSGSARLRTAIAQLHPEAKYSRSEMERRFLSFCRGYALPDPALNAVVGGFTVDALWPAQRVIVELDSWSHHRNRRAFEEDRRRDAKLRLAGYTIIRVTWSWLTEEPDDLAETLRSLLSAPPSRAATA